MTNEQTQIAKALVEYHVGMKRSGHWESVRKAHVLKQPYCMMCGSTDDLQVHHMMPFADNPNLELDDANLITLCETKSIECHLKHGHLGNWHTYNPTISKLAESPGVGKHTANYVNEVDPGIKPVMQTPPK